MKFLIVKLHVLNITNRYVFLLLRYFLSILFFFFDTIFLYDIDMIIFIHIY